MKILVINCGSSTVKYSLFEMPAELNIAKGKVDRIGSDDAVFEYDAVGKQSLKITQKIVDHKNAINIIFAALTDKDNGIVSDIKEIGIVGHRVVHGGDFFSKSIVIDEKVKHGIRECFEYAPLHNPHHLEGILGVEQFLPSAKQVAVFDTAFHQTIPEYAHLYAIPYHYYKKYGIKRYGAHGISHKYVSQRVAKLMNRDYFDCNTITCHLGNGCSITAVKNGQSVDTSMGLTPLEGLIMGTRSGDIDPAVLVKLMTFEGLGRNDVLSILNRSSGLYGISSISNDMRVLIAERAKGNTRAKLAIDMFCYRLKKYIGNYIAVLGHVHALVFTAGIGENVPLVRMQSCAGLEELGVKIDGKINEVHQNEDRLVSTYDSRIQIWVVRTNEELMIANEAHDIITSNG
ncbi:MAG: acetate kinase [Elusimicrobiota bacterium]